MRKRPFQHDAAGILWFVTKKGRRRRVIGHSLWTGRRLRPIPPKLLRLLPKPMPLPVRPVRTDYMAQEVPRPGAQWLGKYEGLPKAIAPLDCIPSARAEV